MGKGKLQFTLISLRWKTTGTEPSSNNKRYRLHISFLLFFGEYQTCCRVPIDKIANNYEVLTRTKVPDIIIISLAHGNFTG